MKYKKLGNSNLEISGIGLGCMGMSEFYGKGDDKESIEVIKKSFELGITFFDTADMYGVGKNEELVGKAIKDIRDKIVLCTKFGNMRGADGSFLGVNGSPDYVKKSCEDSLKRLNVDVIDLYYQHRVDPNTPIEETVEAMSQLVKEGKVRYIGLSEAAPDTIRRAHKVHPISALQTEYSLWTRDPENELLDLCKELGITFVAYSPIGRGFLSGRFKSQSDIPSDDYRKFQPRFAEENMDHNLNIVRELEIIAKEKNCTAAQLALAWVMAQRENIVPIPGTKRIKYLIENAAAIDIQLSEKEIETINKIIPPGYTKGLRYPEATMKALNR
ncbi:MAG: aldo/keto reductase [Ignavibacteria bacterium]|nr:aldo/keto reductase [Ignavibacteria bacterium]